MGKSTVLGHTHTHTREKTGRGGGGQGEKVRGWGGGGESAGFQRSKGRRQQTCGKGGSVTLPSAGEQQGQKGRGRRRGLGTEGSTLTGQRWGGGKKGWRDGG